MRRLVPLIIVVVGLLALAVDFSFWNVMPGSNGQAPTNPITGQPVGTRLGLDLQGGFQVEYKVLPSGGKTPDSSAMSTIAAIIENRINAIGTIEPVVETLGNDQIVVQLPGATNVDQIRSLIGTTGLLQFVPLPRNEYGYVDPSTGTATPGTKSVPAQGDTIDPSLQPLFTGDQLASANPTFDTTTNQRAVSFTLKSQAASKFATYTQGNLGNYFAIVLDGKVVSAPYIQSAITNGQGQISGSFTAAQMNDLVTVLRYGALPFPLQELSNSAIPATLGVNFLHRTLLAGLIGILLVFLFMIIYYRLPGVIASLALIYYALTVFAVFRLIPVTLTLAGAAGFILSVGMAVDANILIFERTREELRAGKTLAAAIEAGFNRAWNSIFDSNMSSLITAFILFYFGTSTIRGFGLVLIIGVATSMFTAVTVSRTLLRVVVRWDWVRQARLFAVREEEFLTVATRSGRPVREAGSRV